MNNLFDDEDLDEVSINFINTKLNNLAFYIKEFKAKFDIQDDISKFNQIINFQNINPEIQNNFDYFIKNYIKKFPNEIVNILSASFNPNFIIDTVMSKNKDKFINIIQPMDLAGFNDIKCIELITPQISEIEPQKNTKSKEVELELF